MNSCEGIKRALTESIVAQTLAVAEWHECEPECIDATEAPHDSDLLRNLVLAQHLVNFRLWHTEDIARRTDVGLSVIADCKYRIDTLNQRRTDAFETVDAYLVDKLRRFIPAPPEGWRPRYNTESLGMVIDRLSILALKVYHMDEQTRRDDVDENHRKTCTAKLSVLEEQRIDLEQAVLDLVDDFCAGVKSPKVYYQFKMYNDPALNPQLYDKNKEVNHASI